MRIPNFDMDALRSFAAGLESGSFAQAADRLGRSTSAISAQLHKLEEQAGTALVMKAGRGLRPTEAGEILLGYARRILALNDEAAAALRGADLEGWLRVGLQQDFGEAVLTEVLGRFARSHPRVRIEGRVDRNADLIERVRDGRLDLALAWDDGSAPPRAERRASVPLCWIGSNNNAPVAPSAEAPLPLVALEAPCVLRSLGCEALDRAGIAWRMAFVSPSVAGLWAATSAGLGVALRTPIGCPATCRCLDPGTQGLPELPKLDLLLLHGSSTATPVVTHMAEILRAAVQDACKMW
ncbi:LysR family transcriptional regulator [Martelella alba]|uniref:LysR family transcriptional regulator n=1 Tax=Martelella alba TaxID=2590451 RepID=A0A506TYP7_9HYPH|nr:LysR substrate-binding domain-containing protein [Martelella alba]TPW27223.1 LysR family transcriptional regulator [Martelella alba]